MEQRRLSIMLAVVFHLLVCYISYCRKWRYLSSKSILFICTLFYGRCFPCFKSDTSAFPLMMFWWRFIRKFLFSNCLLRNAIFKHRDKKPLRNIEIRDKKCVFIFQSLCISITLTIHALFPKMTNSSYFRKETQMVYSEKRLSRFSHFWPLFEILKSFAE